LSNKKYVYVISLTASLIIIGNKIQLIIDKLMEDQILNLHDALDIQINVLTNELALMKEKLILICDGTSQDLSERKVINLGNRTMPPPPRFKRNEVVYLIETSQITGRLEALKINEVIEWNQEIKQWVYSFKIYPRREKNVTVGDRNEILRPYVLEKSENNLCKACEAIPIAISFLEKSINKAKIKREIT